jgi:hypothetical protein
MSDRPKESEPERADRLQKAFDAAAAEGLDLRLAPPDSGPIRCVGVAFACIPLIAYDTVDPEPVDRSDDRAIEHLIREVESLTYEDFRARWRDYLNDPHIAVTDEGLVRVDQEVIDKWFGSERFKQFVEEFVPSSPRDVTVHGIKIVYHGLLQATATYRVEEKHQHGRHTAGNQTAILAKLENLGWRAVVITKGGRQATS